MGARLSQLALILELFTVLDLGILRCLVILVHCCHWKGELFLDINSWTVLAFQIEAGGMAQRSRALSLQGSESHSQHL